MLPEFEAHLIAHRRSSETIKLRLVYLRQLAARVDLAAATTDELEAFIYGNPDWKPNTVNSALASIRVFYKWAHETGRIPGENPAGPLMSLRVPRTLPRVANDIDLRRGINSVSTKHRAMILLGCDGGLRRSEIARAHMRDRRGEWLTITGKGGKQRTVPLTPALLASLTTLEAMLPFGHYFPGEYDGHVSGDVVYRTIRHHVHINPHALRHRAGTAIYRESGNNIRIAQEFLGHESPATTAIYVHIQPSELMAASRAAALRPAA